jgi:hypothetical protein
MPLLQMSVPIQPLVVSEAGSVGLYTPEGGLPTITPLGILQK